jgi:hypothetical protein
MFRRFAAIGAILTNFLRPSRRGPAEKQAESGAMEPEAEVEAEAEAEVEVEVEAEAEAEAEAANAPFAADVNVDSGLEIKTVENSVPDQQEIERRRNLVRMFFNDYWREVFDKPAAFVERLDQAEDYLNERLAANRELWRVDAKTRLMLGLPPRVTSPESTKRTS